MKIVEKVKIKLTMQTSNNNDKILFERSAEKIYGC